MKITDNELKQLVSYDPITGKFFRHDLNREIGGLSSDGYIEMRIRNQHFYGHRLAWFLMTGNWINEVDHINKKL